MRRAARLWGTVAAGALTLAAGVGGAGGCTTDGDTGIGSGPVDLGPAPAGDEVTYYTDFSGPLGPEWDLYDSIGHAGWGLRRPSAITIEDDPTARGGRVLAITARMGEGDEAGLLVSGGMKLRVPQTYGRYTFRVRIEPDPDEVTSGVVLLWPESNEWPRDGEIDIVETWANRDTRTPVETNIHWLDPDAVEPYDSGDDDREQFDHDGVDGTEWHVYQLDWRADRVQLSIDGAPPLVVSDDPAEIADWPMEPTIQLDAFDAPDRPGEQPVMDGAVTMYVDWVELRP